MKANEEEKTELKDDITELRSINEQSAAEIISAKEEAGKDIANMKVRVLLLAILRRL